MSLARKGMDVQMVRAIRGAITVDHNTKEDILDAAKEVVQEAINRNDIETGDIASIIFTLTPDLTKAFPAAGVRQLGITDVPLLDLMQPDIEGALPKCIRLMMHVNSDMPNGELHHVYLRGARVLRPDLLEEQYIAVAIDGPAGAGKSTVSKAAARDLGFLYIDTGAMYRAAALFALNRDIDPIHGAERLVKILDEMSIKISYDRRGQRVFLNGEDVSDEIRTNEVSKAASAVAKIPEVRRRLVKLQRDMAERGNVIMDGRDICSTVLPNAQVKIFLTASVDSRAKRRYKELMEKGMDTTLETVKLDIMARDKNDSERAVSPLRQAEDAVLVDTSDMDFDEAVEYIKDMIKRAITDCKA